MSEHLFLVVSVICFGFCLLALFAVWLLDHSGKSRRDPDVFMDHHREQRGELMRKLQIVPCSRCGGRGVHTETCEKHHVQEYRQRLEQATKTGTRH